MPPVRVKYVVSFSSQAPRNTVEDLVKGRGSWLSDPTDRTGRLQADIQLERATTISYIDLGNAGSVMVSVEVGRSSWPSNKQLVTLLPTVALMTPVEWRAGKNSKTVRMFKTEDLAKDAVKEKWDRVRIICTQPFRKDAQFGLALFQLHTTDESHMQSGSPINQQHNIEQVVQADFRREELVLRMNLPEKKKKVMSQSLGWLENKVLTNGDDANAVNPFTSPVSRAARLVVMASKPTSRENTVSHKANLECEALDFLISLNLNIAEINSLKVSGVRQQFEQQRQKALNHDEKVIFKDIALDYAKNRLESLEKKLESSVENNFGKKKDSVKKENFQKKEKENKFRGYISNDSSRQNICEKERRETPKSDSKDKTGNKASHPSQRQSHGKYTFKKIEAPSSSSASPKATPVSSIEKQKFGDNIDTSLPTGLSRNELALSESKVITPTRGRSRSRKSVTPKAPESNQPTVNRWLTPKAKRKREDSNFSSSDIQQFSRDISDVSNGLDWNDSDDGDEGTCRFIADQSRRDVGALSGHSLGSVPRDKYGVTQARKRSRGNSLDDVHSVSPGSSHSSAMVECPLCCGFFSSSKIESHAASCGIVISSDSESDNSNTNTNDGGSMEECPVCGDFVNSSELQEHAADCASSTFG